MQAARLEETDLAAAVRNLRLAHGPETFSDGELRELFDAEERRVAEAVILSSLLIPRLVASWPAASFAAQPAGGPRTMPAPLPAARRPGPAAGPPAIPDLLDAMLAAERPGRRPVPANPRES